MSFAIRMRAVVADLILTVFLHPQKGRTKCLEIGHYVHTRPVDDRSGCEYITNIIAMSPKIVPCKWLSTAGRKKGLV